MKYVFYIEGADNVGKTTTIIQLKEELKSSNIINYHFLHYPSDNLKDFLNKYSITTKKEKVFISKNFEFLINVLINDMKDSLSNNNNSSIHDDIYICDRGILSTYLYQYKKYIESFNFNNKSELEQLKNFIDTFLNEYYNNNVQYNTIIFHNNRKDISLPIDSTETIEYKKNFDNDKNLQNSINESIDNIVSIMNKENYSISFSNFKFYYIDIYDKNNIRKTKDTIYNEVKNIINQITKKENCSNE